MPDHTRIEARLEDGKSIVIATGPIDSITEVGQQFAWLGAALRSSPFETGVALCIPFVKLNTTEQQLSDLQLPAIPELSCRIEFDLQPHAIASTEVPGQCWHSMFRNPVMAVGFPIPFKSESNPGLGLEMPLNMMATLAGSARAHEFDGKVFIKGFSTMITATRLVGDLIIWHYFYNADGKIITHLDCALGNNFNGSIGLSQVENSRHVVGWCSECKSRTGKSSF